MQNNQILVFLDIRWCPGTTVKWHVITAASQ